MEQYPVRKIEKSTPSNVTVPSESAAIKSARFVMLLDPGTVTHQSIGFSIFLTGYCSPFKFCISIVPEKGKSFCDIIT